MSAPTNSRSRLLRLLPYVGVVVGILVLAAPSLTDLLDSWRASTHISSLSSTASGLDLQAKQELLNQAMRYNAHLAGEGSAELAADSAPGSGAAPESAPAPTELLPYEDQLRTDATSMMAWIQIPGIDVRLPIYHGTQEPALAAGVGHVQGSSLPVGGSSTHCVLTAHSGMAGSRMFDDIRMLEPGDKFVLWTLEEPLAYEVQSSETVPPNQTDSLRIKPGEDLCTLVTCTPYGVNSHRLLVHARRCAYEPEGIAAQTVHVSSRIVPVLVAFAAVALVAASLVWQRRRLRS